jgi:hypothetical protein
MSQLKYLLFALPGLSLIAGTPLWASENNDPVIAKTLNR